MVRSGMDLAQFLSVPLIFNIQRTARSHGPEGICGAGTGSHPEHNDGHTAVAGAVASVTGR